MKIFFLLLAVFCAGCASVGVEPWERETLSRKEMQFGADSVDQGYSEHFYFSKEGSSGGSGFSGGGCGCN